MEDKRERIAEREKKRMSVMLDDKVEFYSEKEKKRSSVMMVDSPKKGKSSKSGSTLHRGENKSAGNLDKHLSPREDMSLKRLSGLVRSKTATEKESFQNLGLSGSDVGKFASQDAVPVVREESKEEGLAEVAEGIPVKKKKKLSRKSPRKKPISKSRSGAFSPSKLDRKEKDKKRDSTGLSSKDRKLNRRSAGPYNSQELKRQMIVVRTIFIEAL